MAEGTLSKEDTDAIVEVFKKTLTNIPQEDFADWLVHWTADARLMPPGMADVVGHDALKHWMRGWPKIKRFDIVDIDVEGSGDLAVLICHFVRELEAPEDGESKQKGRQVLKFRRQPDGRWLIANAIFNADLQGN